MPKTLLLLIIAFSFSLPALAQSDLEEEKRLSREYLQRMAREANAQVLDDGVVMKTIFQSDSDIYPTESSIVSATYHLTDREGNIIEDSLASDQYHDFPLDRLISCWAIAVPNMSKGSVAKFTCPSDTAYGDQGRGPIKGGAALTFRINLLDVK